MMDHKKEIARQILTSSIARDLNPRTKVALENILEGWNVGSTYVSVEFIRSVPGAKDRDNVGCTLYIDDEARWNYSDKSEDADGNLLRTCTWGFQVNWSAYGTSSFAVTREFATLLLNVAVLAEELKEMFGEPHKVVYITKAERDEQALVQAQKARMEKVKQIVEANRGGMRVGSERMMHDAELFRSLESHTYYHEVAGKKYALIVTEGVGACLMRVL